MIATSREESWRGYLWRGQPQRHRAVEADAIRLRTALVTHQGWLDLGNAQDHDRYDDDPTTWHFAVQRRFAGDRVVSGAMRLTVVPEPTSCLSVQMWADPHQAEIQRRLQDVIPLIEAARQSRLYDLTRLATAYEAGMSLGGLAGFDLMSVALDDCFALLGMGAACTLTDAERRSGPSEVGTIWIFTINASVRRALDHANVDYTVLYEGSNVDGEEIATAYLSIFRQGLNRVDDTPLTKARQIVGMARKQAEVALAAGPSVGGLMIALDHQVLGARPALA